MLESRAQRLPGLCRRLQLAASAGLSFYQLIALTATCSTHSSYNYNDRDSTMSCVSSYMAKWYFNVLLLLAFIYVYSVYKNKYSLSNLLLKFINNSWVIKPIACKHSVTRFCLDTAVKHHQTQHHNSLAEYIIKMCVWINQWLYVSVTDWPIGNKHASKQKVEQFLTKWIDQC
jgi:hypothetical protein